MDCKDLVRPQLNVVVNKEIAEAIGRDYRTLPIFEKALYDYSYIKHYSLKRNEFLKCHWAKYTSDFADRVFTPFQFLDVRDYHFYNCRNRFIPEKSIHTKTDFRRKLKPGPGVDAFGNLPIPQELLMKRSGKKIEKKKIRSSQK